MEQKIKDLSLLLLYLTSWEEEDLPKEIRRSWKGYPFDILDDLNDEECIHGSKQAKSVYLTKKGIEKAKDSARKYGIEEEKDG